MILEDVLDNNLEVVICGMAVGRKSAAAGAYYAHPGNRFWRIIFGVGLTDRLLMPSEFRELLKYRIGLTDLAKARSGVDSDLMETDFDRESLMRKMKTYQPKLLCFNGLRPGRVFFKKTAIAYGLQTGVNIHNTQVFVAHSTSPKNGHWQEFSWREIGHLVRRAKRAT